MDLLNSIVFGFILLFISIYGILRSSRSANSSNSETRTSKKEVLVGSNVSVGSVALSVCSSYISAISIIGFPSEVYYRGTMIFWFAVMYCISFPIVAYVFLPVFYQLQLSSLYEYLEKRFCFSCRVLASSTFILQMLFYLSVAIYAPALALSAAFHMPMFLAILLTAFISAIYLLAGGARAAIFTSALQMLTIIGSLLIICVASFVHWDWSFLYENVRNGARINFSDFRLDPRVRHSVFPLLIGGSCMIFRVVLLNILLNSFMLTAYVIIGLVIYAVFHGCHPISFEKDKLLPYFVQTQLKWLPLLEGIFMAALYSAGVSTLTGTYNALTTVTLEDVLKPVLNHISPSYTLSTKAYLRLAKYLPFFFGTFAACGAFLVHKWDAMILQISLSIFGSAGGGTFGVFCVGIFCPWITSKMAALSGQITSTLMCFLLVAGAAINKVQPVNLPLSPSCQANTTIIFTNDDSYGRVVSTDEYPYVWSSISEVSYQYYSVIGLCVCLFVSHILQLIENCLLGNDKKKVDPRLLATFLRTNTQEVLLRNDVCLKDSLLPT